MKTLLLSFMVTLMMLLGACATQPSSPPQPTVTPAQMATDYEAMANVTFKCPSCTDEQKAQLMEYMVIKYNMAQGTQAAGRTGVADADARSAWAGTANWRIDRAIDQLLFEVLQNY